MNMYSDLSKFKNIDKSTVEIFHEKDHFSLLYFENSNAEIQFNSFDLEDDYIQIYFGINSPVKVAFNMEHCAIEVDNYTSGLIFIKEPVTKVLTTLEENTELLALLIPVSYFHSLFANKENPFFNIDFIKGSKPIIEQNSVSKAIANILNQIIHKRPNGSFESIFLKGKIYELLSLYFDTSQEDFSESCPFIANEETVLKIKKVKDLIIENMANPPSLEQLSKEVGLNLKKLKEAFKEFYGTPVFTFLLNYKLDYSKKLLEENKLNVSEIAALVGYSNSSHFIAAFKKKFNITPKQFTKQI